MYQTYLLQTVEETRWYDKLLFSNDENGHLLRNTHHDRSSQKLVPPKKRPTLLRLAHQATLTRLRGEWCT